MACQQSIGQTLRKKNWPDVYQISVSLINALDIVCNINCNRLHLVPTEKAERQSTAISALLDGSTVGKLVHTCKCPELTIY